MGFTDLFKPKKRESSINLDIPKAPPSEEELPELPVPQKAPNLEPEEPMEKPASSVVKKIEDDAVKDQQQDIDLREDLSLQKPIFMPIEVFKDLAEEIQLINHILKENDDTLVRVSQFKEDENKEFKKWDSNVTDIQKKLVYVDKILFGKSEG